MPILYSVVAHGNSVLARYARCAGNFAEVTEQIISKISPDQPKLTYSHGSYLFHYIYENQIVYLCITDDEFDRSRAFVFLNEIKKRFQITYGSRALTALPYAMNNEFSRILAAQMKHFSESQDVDKIAKTQEALDELKEIMVQNIGILLNAAIEIIYKNDWSQGPPVVIKNYWSLMIMTDSVANRGEKLELLVDKTENLNASNKKQKPSSIHVFKECENNNHCSYCVFEDDMS